MDTNIKSNVIKIFEYLTALKNLSSPVLCDMRQYREACWWLADMPKDAGCFWNGSGAHPEAWLEVQQREVPPPPPPPEPLRKWILDSGLQPEQPPVLHNTLHETEQPEVQDDSDFIAWIEGLQSEQVQPETQPAVEASEVVPLTFTLAEETEMPSTNGRRETAFDSDPERVALWEHWRGQVWEAWAAAASEQQCANQLYDDFFALYQRMQREGDHLELVLGDGLLTWQVAAREIFRPLFVVRADLVFDAEKKSFAILLLEPSAALELEMLSGVPLARAELLSAVEARMREQGIDLREKGKIKNVLSEIAPAFSFEAEARVSEMQSGRNLELTSQPILYHAPALFVRSKAGRQWQADFKTIIDAIRNDHPIAPSLAVLAMNSPLSPSEAESQKWQPLGEDILFPLPANEEQREIARRLAQHFGVAVQGPPGTGKSHTIVNLIAHLLAHGKRVLVTSHAERALRVLGEMIKRALPELAPLCLAVLEGEAQSREQLEAAITDIYERLAAFDVEAAARMQERLAEELRSAREEIARLREELRHAAETENDRVCIQGRDLKATQVAEWLTQNETKYGWLPDKIPAECDPPLSEIEMLRLCELLGVFSVEHLALLSQKLPPLEQLPTTAQVSQYCERLSAFETAAPRREELLRGWTLPATAPADLDQKMALAERALRKLESFTAPWLRSVLQDVAYGGQREEQWQEFTRECRVQLRSIRAEEKAIAHYSVAVPVAFDLKQAREDLTLLHDELARNKTVSLRFRYGSGKRALRVFNEYLLNGNAPRTAEDVQVLLRYLDIDEAKRKLLATWTNGVREVGGPAPEAENEQLLKLIEDYLRLLEPVLGWNNTYLRLLTASTSNLKPYGAAAWHETEWLKKYCEGLRAYAEILASAAVYEFFEEWTRYLRAGMAGEHAHAAWARLLEALEAHDAQTWERELQALQSLAAFMPQLRELQQLREKLRAVAPRWLLEIEKQSGGAEPALPVEWQKAWEWRRVHSWFEQSAARLNVEDSYERLRAAHAKAARTLASFVAQSTWLEQAKRTTPEQKTALYAWLKTMQKLSKSGKGKYENRYRSEAAQLMQTCRPAIPVWIMPLEQVLATFSPTGEKFDVVIVDESSQCQLFALAALFRAERAVIIGDHKQVSPEAVGIEQAEVHELMARHLHGLPQVTSAMWDLQASLFDKAQEAFSPSNQSLFLREHFRCAPEIIRFSNEQFYENKIEPLRLPLPHERCAPVLVTVRVPDGQWKQDSAAAVNVKEAEAIADKIVELCRDESYAQRTMGVISLQGVAQAELIAGLLRERLSAEEIVKRRLLCGDAKHFQGDERHVMFLSMVASAEPRPGPLTNKFAEQRFNVAASRARDQLWLFHSIDAENLQPNCMRYRLLDYCLHPEREAQARRSALETFEYYGTSPLVREIYRQVIARGHRVTPEVKIGTHPFRIDLVIEGEHSRLGVLCEGEEWRGEEDWEEELERQLVLERAGWKFWRVRGSVYYHAPEKALAPLWGKLEELGIRPAAIPEGWEEIARA